LRGMNLGYKRMGLQAACSVVGGALMAGAAYFGAGLIGVAGAQLALSVVTGVLFWILVKKYVPWFGIAWPSRAELKSFFGLSGWNFLGTVIARLHFGSDVIVLGIMASASTVTTYVITAYAAQSALMIINLICLAVAPGLGGLIGLQQYEKAASVRSEMLAMNWLSVTAAGSCILLWNPSFVHLWVGSQYYAGSWSDLLIVLIITQTAIMRSDACVIDASLQLRNRVLVNILAAVLTIPLMVALTPAFGIFGLCLGALGGRLLQLVTHPFMANACLGRPQRLPLTAIARASLVMCLLFAGCGYVGQRVMASNWFELLGGVAVTLTLTSCLALLAGLTKETRGQLIHRLGSLRKSFAR
jgi:O-antigen/teichoic acid export membrane protein